MTPIDSILLFASAAPLLYLALLFFSRARRLNRELYLPLGWGMTALVAVEIGWALCLSTRNGATLAWGHSIAFAGINAALLPYCYTLNYGEVPHYKWPRKLAWVWTLLGIFIAASSLASDAGSILTGPPEKPASTHVYTSLARAQGLGISVITLLTVFMHWYETRNTRFSLYFLMASFPGIVGWVSLISQNAVNSELIFWAGSSIALAALAFSALPVYLGLKREGELAVVTQLARSEEETLVHEKDTLRKAAPLATLGSLSQLIAHEVRNPLSAITNAASALRLDSLTAAERATLIDILDKEADQIDQLTDDLLVYAKAPAEALETISVEHIISECISLHRDKLEAFGLTVIFDTSPQESIIDSDRDMLSAAVERMLLSAPRNSEGLSPVRVTVRENQLDPSKTISIVVSEEPPSSHEDSSPESTNTMPLNPRDGAGLHLAIVEKAANFHDGEVELHEKEGLPWQMILHLPLRSQSHPEPQTKVGNE